METTVARGCGAASRALMALLAATSLLTSPAIVQGADQITFRLAWVPGGTVPPLYVPLEKGWYREQGLEVQILPGQGSVSTIKLVANRTDTFGMADTAAMLKAIVQGLPVKMVASIFQKNCIGVIYRLDSGIRGARDLVGKSIAMTPESSAAQLFPAFLAATGLSSESVTVAAAGAGILNKTILLKKVPAIVGFPCTHVPIIEAEGVKVGVLDFWDHGVKTLANGIVTSLGVIQERPDLVRRFLRAAVRGHQYAAERPEEAVDIMLKYHPALKREPTLRELQLFIPRFHTDATKGKVIGWSAPEDWQRTQEVMQKYGGLQTTVPVERAHTNEFLPGL